MGRWIFAAIAVRDTSRAAPETSAWTPRLAELGGVCSGRWIASPAGTFLAQTFETLSPSQKQYINSHRVVGAQGGDRRRRVRRQWAMDEPDRQEGYRRGR